MREQVDHDQLIARVLQRLIASIPWSKPIGINSVVNDDPDALAYCDVVAGAKLDPELARQARHVEMQFFWEKGAYYRDTVGNSMKTTGEGPI